MSLPLSLSGYEDVRRKSTDGFNMAEQSKINTSVYAFLNVIHALSVNGCHVPYRESKLGRILQDSLGGLNKVLMITCLVSLFTYLFVVQKCPIFLLVILFFLVIEINLLPRFNIYD